MAEDIWKECMNCNEKCCAQRKIAFPLFLTGEEKKTLFDTNKVFPCKFFSREGFCATHETRPLDCRLFPFEMVKENGVFYWIYWNTNCPITRKGYKKEWEIHLQKVEAEILPSYLFEDIDAYSQFRVSELIETFGRYTILRKTNLKKNGRRIKMKNFFETLLSYWQSF